MERPASARCSRSVSAAYFFSTAGIRLSSRSCSNLAKPATFSGANWLPVALSSASARPLGMTTIIGTAALSAIRLSKRASGAAKRIHSVSSPPIPCSRYRTGYLVSLIPGRQVDVRFAPRAGDPRVVLEWFETTGRDAGAPRVEARGRVRERPDIVGAEHDGPAHVAATLRGRRCLGLLLSRRCGSGDEEQDRGDEYVSSVFHKSSGSTTAHLRSTPPAADDAYLNSNGARSRR